MSTHFAAINCVTIFSINIFTTLNVCVCMLCRTVYQRVNRRAWQIRYSLTARMWNKWTFNWFRTMNILMLSNFQTAYDVVYSPLDMETDHLPVYLSLCVWLFFIYFPPQTCLLQFQMFISLSSIVDRQNGIVSNMPLLSVFLSNFTWFYQNSIFFVAHVCSNLRINVCSA